MTLPQLLRKLWNNCELLSMVLCMLHGDVSGRLIFEHVVEESRRAARRFRCSKREVCKLEVCWA